MSVMFVKISTPEGQIDITIEKMAEEIARSNYEQAKGGKSMYDTLTSLRDAGIISASYVNDFMDAAVILARYVPASKFMPTQNKRYSTRTRQDFIQVMGLSEDYERFCARD